MGVYVPIGGGASPNLFTDTSGNLHIRPTPGSDANAIICQTSPGQIQFYGPSGQELYFMNNAGGQAGLYSGQANNYQGVQGASVWYYNNLGWPQLNAPLYDNQNNAVGTISGTTAGSIFYNEPRAGSSYKKLIAMVNGYQNNTATAQTFNFPIPFTSVNQLVTSPSGFTPTFSLTTVTLPTSMGAAVNGIFIIEGR